MFGAMTPVSHVMRDKFISIRPTDRMGFADELLECGAEILPVLDRGRFVGLLCLRRLIQLRRSYDCDSRVADLMLRGIECLREDATIAAAARRIISEDLPCLPVTRDIAVVGIVTPYDLLGGLV